MDQIYWVCSIYEKWRVDHIYDYYDTDDTGSDARP